MALEEWEDVKSISHANTFPGDNIPVIIRIQIRKRHCD